MEMDRKLCNVAATNRFRCLLFRVGRVLLHCNPIWANRFLCFFHLPYTKPYAALCYTMWCEYNKNKLILILFALLLWLTIAMHATHTHTFDAIEGEKIKGWTQHAVIPNCETQQHDMILVARKINQSFHKWKYPTKEIQYTTKPVLGHERPRRCDEIRSIASKMKFMTVRDLI